MKRASLMVGLYPVFLVLLTALVPTRGARVGLRTGGPPKAPEQPKQVPATAERGGHTAVHQQVDLADVLAKSVALMNSGVEQFLNEEGKVSLPPRGETHELRSPEDFWRVAKSQEKAIMLLRQVASDFSKLGSVAQKLSAQQHRRAAHESACAGNRTASKEKELRVERNELKTTVEVMLKRAQTCEDKLDSAQKVADSCAAMTKKQVKEKEAADEELVDGARDESDELRKANEELTAENAALSKRIAGLQGSAEDQAGAVGEEVKELRKKIESLEADKQGLVYTVQHFMKTNETEALTRSMRSEIGVMRREELTAETRNEKIVAKLEEELNEAQGKNKDLKEVAQSLQTENVNAQQENEKANAEVRDVTAAEQGLQADKKQLLNTLQGVLRENTQFQQELKQVRAALAHAQAQLPVANAAKEDEDQPASAPQAHVQTRSAKARNSDSDAVDVDDPVATMGQMSSINRYVNMAGHEDSEQTSSSSASEDPTIRAAEVVEDSKPQKTMALSRWLHDGVAPVVIQAQQPAAAPVQAEVGGGDQAGDLLEQAQKAVSEAADDGADSDSTSDE